MTLPETKSGGAAIPFSHRKILLFGPPKIGKTSIVAGLGDEILFLAFERGHDDVNVHLVEINKWADFENAIKELKGNQKFKMVCIDTLDSAFVMYRQHFLNKAGKESEYDFSRRGEGWLGLRRGFRDAFFNLQLLGRGYIIIAHQREDERSEGNVVVRPNYPMDKANEMRGVIEGVVDAIWYMNSKTMADGDGDPVKTRIIYTGGDTPGIECGCRFPMSPEIVLVPNDPAASARKLLDDYRAHNAPKTAAKKEAV